MKRLIAFLLIAVFLYTQVGYFIAFKAMQYEVRREIKAKIKQSVPQQELTVIEVTNGSANKLRWEKENKEFWYKGELYDIVRKEMSAGTIVYHCINDTQEKTLFTHLDDLVKRNMSDPMHGKHAAKTVVKDYFVEELIVPSANEYRIIQYPVTTETLITHFTPPASPPPEAG